MSGEDLLKRGYNAYGEYVHWQNHLGKPMPTWEQLPPLQRGAFAAFLREVVAELQK